MQAATTVSQPSPLPPSLLDVRQTANFLNMSESWVRRNEKELPAVRLGRALRFNPELLNLTFSGKVSSGKSLVGNESPVIGAKRYQSGMVYLTGKKKKMWYGKYREDAFENGTLVRTRKNVPLGSLGELPTKTAARQELLKRMQTTNKPTAQLTLAEVVERWKTSKLPTLKLSTQGVYLSGLKVVLESLGKFPIRQIDREMVERFLAVKSKKYSRNSLLQFLRALSVVCMWAIPKYLDVSPCRGIKRGKNFYRGNPARELERNKKIRPEQASLLSKALKEPYATLVMFLYNTGVRIGEALALKWSDFDGLNLTIQRRIYNGKIDTLKTASDDDPESGLRKLTLKESVLTRLESLGRKCEWVFPSRAKTPLDDGNVLRRIVKPKAQKLGISLAGFHDFRHSATRQLGIEQKENPKVVSGILGHATTKEMFETYTHAGTADYAEPLGRLADKFFQPVQPFQAVGT